jgi:hypothetical protein
LVIVREEADLLRNAIFDDGEVALTEAGYDAALSIMDAKGDIDEVGLDLNDWDVLRVK